MARYPKEHKARTRKRIVQTASRAFREAGIEGTSVPEIMARADLTRGGFYAHFPSKSALVAEACSETVFGSSLKLPAIAYGAAPGNELLAILDHYLSVQHRDDLGGGCAIPALSGELVRAPIQVRREFTEALRQFFGSLAPFVSDDAERVYGDAELALVATMVGGLLLARVVDDSELSEHILATCRQFCANSFGDLIPPTEYIVPDQKS